MPIIKQQRAGKADGSSVRQLGTPPATLAEIRDFPHGPRVNHGSSRLPLRFATKQIQELRQQARQFSGHQGKLGVEYRLG